MRSTGALFGCATMTIRNQEPTSSPCAPTPAFQCNIHSPRVIEDDVLLTEIGSILEAEWLQTAQMRHSVIVDAYVVMPNHLHGILVLTEEKPVQPMAPPKSTGKPSRYGPASGSVSAILAGFKSAVTSRIRKYLDMREVQVWQRNYFEHIIRNDKSLNLIREYITMNPLRWTLDRYNPDRCGSDEMAQKVWRALTES